LSAERHADALQRSHTRGDAVLLSVNGLSTWFESRGRVVKAVDGLHLSVNEGETLGLVGESGCGKSATALSILRLVSPPGRIVSGSIEFEGRDLLSLSDAEMRAVRGREIGMVFQEPSTALNPVFTVGEQIAETLRYQRGMERVAADARAIELLDKVGVAEPSLRVRSYPHQLSGGERQRASIAMAIACGPKLLIADEPTTALDVTVAAAVFDLLGRLQDESGLGLLFITHDLSRISSRADRVAVMYGGRVVEEARTKDLLAAPSHPYTIGLLRSLPKLTPPGERLRPIPGRVPSAAEWPSGCRFRTRCPIARAECAAVEPPLQSVDGAGSEHAVACLFASEARSL
jgi:oligopeptide/dipeptide ABC transporter ATP-binding protein